MQVRIAKTCYYSVKLQQYFLYKLCTISHLLYTWKLFFILVFINILFDYKCLLENIHLDMKNLKKKRKKKEKLIESKKWSMDKFVISNKQNITQNLYENIKNDQEIHQNNLEENDVQFCNTTNLDNELQNNLEENENNDEEYNIKILNKH